MRMNPLVLIIAAFGLLAVPSVSLADKLDMEGAVSESELKPNLSQPYIVKKGDTLWDIADYFFKNPWKWLKIWERNLYITNPDLIYPGNQIWFDGRNPGGLSSVRPQPKVKIKPVERLEGAYDSSVMMTVLSRQDFVHPNEVQGVGHILDSSDSRLNFGAHDRLYVKLNNAAKPGDLFDVFRTSDALVDPLTGEAVGVLVIHLGQVRITSMQDGVYRADVDKAFEEISRGDRLKPSRDPDLRIEPKVSDQPLRGQIIYIRNDGREAAQHQIIGVTLGISDGVKAGTVMSIYQSGRVVDDKVTSTAVRLPDEKVGELIILVPQEQASMALITSSTAPIHIGDAVVSNGRQ